jgi:5-methylcytosine-specific restriction protein A
MGTFETGGTYTRLDVYDVVGVPAERRRGNWETGYTSFEGEVFIFATIGAPGRSGHDYDNGWDGRQLRWRGKTRSRLHHPSISIMLEPTRRVNVFTRTDNRDPFTYEGLGRVVSTQDTEPVTIVWTFDSPGL